MTYSMRLVACGLLTLGLVCPFAQAFNGLSPLALKPSLRQGKAISSLTMQMRPAASEGPSRRDMLASSAALAAAAFFPKMDAFAEVT
jgi:hypothetical protein